MSPKHVAINQPRLNHLVPSSALCMAGAYVLLALLLAIPLAAQEVRWPANGSLLRITTLPGPPLGVVNGLATLNLTGESSSLRRAEDGTVRFTASLVGTSAMSIDLSNDSPGGVATFTLSALESVQVYGGSRSNGKRGVVAGAVIGGVLGALLVNAIGESPGFFDYVGGMAGFAIPPALVGGLIGVAIRTDVWETVYPTNDVLQPYNGFYVGAGELLACRR